MEDSQKPERWAEAASLRLASKSETRDQRFPVQLYGKIKNISFDDSTKLPSKHLELCFKRFVTAKTPFLVQRNADLYMCINV